LRAATPEMAARPFQGWAPGSWAAYGQLTTPLKTIYYLSSVPLIMKFTHKKVYNVVNGQKVLVKLSEFLDQTDTKWIVIRRQKSLSLFIFVNTLQVCGSITEVSKCGVAVRALERFFSAVSPRMCG
jgi:hypothetical protein